MLAVRSGSRLQVSISTIFALLILPALALVIGFNYYENASNLESLQQRLVDRATDDARSMSRNLLEPVAATLHLMAAAESRTCPVSIAAIGAGSCFTRR